MSYRTSVLNDFSTVRKAFFQVYHDEGYKHPSFAFSKEMVNRNFKFVDQFPVQLNPNSLHLDYYGKSKQQLKPIDSRFCAGVPLRTPDPSGGGNAGEVSIELKYNIYDEYNARTMNGAIPGSEISLHSDGQKVTSLEELRKYAGRFEYYTMFIWGDIHIFGFLEDLKVDYTAFSCWGEPLTATANITIQRQGLEYDKNGIEKDPLDCINTLGSGIVEARFYRMEYDIAMRVGLLATNALR